MALTDRIIKLSEPKDKIYRVSDAGGLYIEIHPNGGKYWRQKYRFGGKEKRFAIGTYPLVSLKEAREKREEIKRMIANGIDPGQRRKEEKRAQQGFYKNTFEEIGQEWFKVKMSSKSQSYTVKIHSALRRDVYPFIGNMNIAMIEPPEVLHLLRRIENRGAIETAHRTKNYMSQIFLFGIATGRCRRDPTKDLRGALTPYKSGHFAAITDTSKVGKLMSDLYHYNGTPQVKAALLCSAMWFLRPVEIRNIRWENIKWSKEQIEIMAAKKEDNLHIIPLSTQSIEILRALHKITGHTDFVFVGVNSRFKGISENTVLQAIRNLGYTKEEMTAHGFRAMARTILDEELEFDEKLTEKQLAHQVKDPLGRAYNRTAHIKLRREMMQKWADYLFDEMEKYEVEKGIREARRPGDEPPEFEYSFY